MADLLSMRAENPSAILLDVSNFQSIKHQTFIISGLTVMTGESNNGKSAAFRALRAILENVWPSNFIRTGETQCELNLWFPLEDTHEIERLRFIRTKTKNEYSVFYRERAGALKKPPSIYPKVGKSIPDEVLNLGFGLLTSERGDSFSLIMQRQHNYFMIGKTPTAFTSLLNTVFGVGRYEAAVKNVNRDILDLNQKDELYAGQQAQLEEGVRTTQASLSALETELSEKVKVSQALSTASDSCHSALNALKVGERLHALETVELPRSQQEIDTIKHDLSQIESLLSLLQTLSVVGSDRKELEVSTGNLDSTVSSITQEQGSLAALSVLHKAADLAVSFSVMQGSIVEARRQAELVSRISLDLEATRIDHDRIDLAAKLVHPVLALGSHNKTLANFKAVKAEIPKLESTVTQLSNLSGSLSAVFHMYQNSLFAAKGLRELESVSESSGLRVQHENHTLQQAVNVVACIEKINQIRASISDIGALHKGMASLNTSIVEAKDQQTQAVGLYQSVLKQYGRCPTCDSQMNCEH